MRTINEILIKNIPGSQVLDLPEGSSLLSIHNGLNGALILHYEGDKELPNEQYTIYVQTADDLVPPNSKYIATTTERGWIAHLYQII